MCIYTHLSLYIYIYIERERYRYVQKSPLLLFYNIYCQRGEHQGSCLRMDNQRHESKQVNRHIAGQQLAGKQTMLRELPQTFESQTTSCAMTQAKPPPLNPLNKNMHDNP